MKSREWEGVGLSREWNEDLEEGPFERLHTSGLFLSCYKSLGQDLVLSGEGKYWPRGREGACGCGRALAAGAVCREALPASHNLRRGLGHL